MAAAKAINYHAEEAKKRQLSSLKQNQDTVPVNLPERGGKGDARDKVGKLFKVPGKSVSDASLVQKHGTQEEIKAVEKHSVAPVSPLKSSNGFLTEQHQIT